MRKYIVYICSIAAFFLSSTIAFAQFPYQNTLTKGDEFSQFDTNNQVEFDRYGATLTPSYNSGKGMTRGFYLNDLTFTVSRGFVIEFDYLMTGGAAPNFADGLALVLFDGSVKTPKIGSSGSGLGYAYKKGSPVENGLSKGFLAVGIDLWGSFKFRRSESSEYRNGIRNGALNSTLIADSDRPGKQGESRNHITIRGQGDGSSGYPVLITQSTTNFESRTMMNFATGLYDKKPDAPQEKSFTFPLRQNTGSNENDLTAGVGHASYRRLSISMLPGTKDNKKGFFMIVDLIHGTLSDRIIKDYFLPDNEQVIYQEVSSMGEGSNVATPMTLKAPNTFKLGFIGSIGGYSQRQIVRNLSLYMPFSPIVGDVTEKDVCKDIPTEIDVLKNGLGFNSNTYKGGGDLSVYGKREYLDPYSFQFKILVDGSYEDTAHPYTAVTPVGTYEYNPVTTKVFFVPNKGVTIPASDEVYFSIRNKDIQLANDVNLGSETFRSNSAKLTLEFGKNCNDILMVNGNSI